MISKVKHQTENWFMCTCDGCGEIAENEEGNLKPCEATSAELADDLGWENFNTIAHYCPDCKDEEK